MLTTSLHIRGNADFKVRSAALRFGLGRDSYIVKGEVRKDGLRQGEARPFSMLQIKLSTANNMAKHMAEVEHELDKVLSLVALERRRQKCELEVYLSTGLTVGHQKQYYTRTVTIPSALMAKLAALEIRYEISCYPSY